MDVEDWISYNTTSHPQGCIGVNFLAYVKTSEKGDLWKSVKGIVGFWDACEKIWKIKEHVAEERLKIVDQSSTNMLPADGLIN